MSEYDISNVETYLNEGLPVYSKILVQFEEGFDVDLETEDGVPYDEIAENINCWDSDDEKSQHIYYPTGKEAFAEVVEYFKDYDCMIFQFKFI